MPVNTRIGDNERSATTADTKVVDGGTAAFCLSCVFDMTAAVISVNFVWVYRGTPGYGGPRTAGA
jgi:hypothetical protein